MQNYTIIGVMSGTSLDGIDIALLHFSLHQNKWKYQILKAETYPYEQQWIDKLKNAHLLKKEEIDNLNLEYTQYLALKLNDFINKENIPNIDAICSHGHTILHQPQNGLTLQIGNLPILSDLTNQTVVCDFRVQDVKLGGNGAPLVPLGDKLLFSDFTYRINLGGFSNISYEIGDDVIAYDICPVNTVLNRLAAPLNYDEKGQLAANGTINQELLLKLNSLEFYKRSPPKSLGIEWVYTEIIPLLEQCDISKEDKLCTFCEHIAQQISNSTKNGNGSTLFTGGGVHNQFLMSRIQNYIQNVQILDKQTSDFKEALIFGFLGILKLRGEINVLKSVTGAKQNHSSGEIFIKQVK